MVTKFDAANDELDLVLTRVIDVSRDKVWRCWTEPELLLQWFSPAPWKTVECDLELRPGGVFRTVMVSPEGEQFDNTGCVLEVVPGERFVFTDALLPGFRPAPQPFFTGVIVLEDAEGGTRYTATAVHGNKEACQQHEAMGFHDGWGKALDQLSKVAKDLG